MSAITSYNSFLKSAVAGTIGATYFWSLSNLFFDVLNSKGVVASEEAIVFHQSVSILSGLIGGIIAQKGISKLEKPWQKIVALAGIANGTHITHFRCAELAIEFLAKNSALTLQSTAVYKLSLIYSFIFPASLIAACVKK